MKFFLIILLLANALMCNGCGALISTLAYNNISEIQRDILVGGSQGIEAKLVIGSREVTYKKDGYSTREISYAILSFSCENSEGIVADKCTLVCGKNVYEGDLQINPYLSEVLVDLGEIQLDNIVVATIYLADKSVDIALLSITEDLEVSGLDALDIILENDKGVIKRLKKGGDFLGEIYIRVLGEVTRNSDNLNWGITILTRKGERLNYVVSSVTGEILLT